MTWELAGKHVCEVDDALAAHDITATERLRGLPAEIDDEAYLVRSMHLIPYFPAAAASDDQSTRERLNIELCDRVFRISDARDVTRRGEDADEAIAVLMARFEQSAIEEKRGIGRVLFARIVSRIRDLSRIYLELRREQDHALATTMEQQLLQRIHDLYHYVMVQQRDIFACVRLYDHSIDHDGIIEEVFSEIGKTQRVPIDTIYSNRVIKIGAAMAGIEEVADTMTAVLSVLTSLPLDPLRSRLRHYSGLARRLTGIPSSDHLAYDEVAGLYVGAHDCLRDQLLDFDALNLRRDDAHLLAEWLKDGLNLMHSLQNIRDGRTHSIAAYQRAAGRWTDIDLPKLVKAS